jgi:hypothetical protein
LKNRGTFLIDLKLDPADGSDLAMHVPDLVTRCAALKLRRIVPIKATVFDAAYRPLLAAGLPVVNKRVQEFYEGGSDGRKVPGSTRLPLRVISTGSSIGLASSSKGFTPGAKLSSVITPSTVSKPRPKLSS